MKIYSCFCLLVSLFCEIIFVEAIRVKRDDFLAGALLTAVGVGSEMLQQGAAVITGGKTGFGIILFSRKKK